MRPGESVEDYITRIQRPGNGYGSGCREVARTTGETEGVAWTRVTVIDNATEERERIYLTESGHRVEHCTGQYGDGVRWAVHGPHISGGFAGQSLSYVANLTQAFTVIARAQRAQQREES